MNIRNPTARMSRAQWQPAYGFAPKQDLLQQLLDLNHTVAAAEKAGQPVTAPGVPAGYGDPAGLITADCIRAE